MNKTLIFLALIGLLASCNSNGFSSGSNAELATVEDSTYYAFGASVANNFPLKDVDLNADYFSKGLTDVANESETMDLLGAEGYLRQLFMEAQQKTDSTGQLSSSLTTDLDSASYAYGVYFAKNLADINMEVKTPQLSAGFADAIAGTSKLEDPVVKQQLEQQFSMLLQQKSMEAMQARIAAEAGPNKEEGQQFMATNKEKAGVIEHESGMQYEVLKSGDANGESPSTSDQVTIHYEGRLLDGTVFDSSVERGEPVTFALAQLVRGWQIALPLMKPGDKWRIYLPSDLAYGDQGSPPRIPPGATGVFDIEYFGKE